MYGGWLDADLTVFFHLVLAPHPCSILARWRLLRGQPQTHARACTSMHAHTHTHLQKNTLTRMDTCDEMDKCDKIHDGDGRGLDSSPYDGL